MLIKQCSKAVMLIFIFTISFTLLFIDQSAYAEDPDETSNIPPISSDEAILEQDKLASDISIHDTIDNSTNNGVLDLSDEAEEVLEITQDKSETSQELTDDEAIQYDNPTINTIENEQALPAVPMPRLAPAAPVAKAPAVQLSATDKLAQQYKNTLQNDHIYIITSALNTNVALASQNEKTATRTNVDIEALTRNTTQQWRTSIDALGYVTFIHEASGLALDLYNGDPKNKQNVWLFTPNDSLAQKWIVITDSTGTRIASALDTNLVLDLYYGKTASGTNVWMWENTKTSDQRWNFYDLTQARFALDKRATAAKSYISAGQYQLLSAKKLDMSGMPANNNARANISLQNSNGSASQSWKVSIDNKGYATFINTSSGKALDVYNANAINYTNVWQFNSNNSLAQKWIIEKNTDGTYTITSALYPDMVLDIYDGATTAGTNIQLYNANKTAAQKWFLLPVTPNVAKSATLTTNKWYTLAPTANKNIAIDVYDASTANKANTWLFSKNSTLAQDFRFVSNGAGYYYIENAASGNVLDVTSGKQVHGTNIQQYAKSNTSNQLFSATRNSDGTYTFTNVATGLVLATDSLTPDKRSNLVAQVLVGTPTNAQKFSLTLAKEFFTEGIYSLFTDKTAALAIDVADGSDADNATIWMFTSNKTFAQKWYITPTSSYNVYTLQSIQTGKYLTANSNGTVSQKAGSGTNSQKWYIDAKAGQFVLKNVSTNTYLDAKNNSEQLKNSVVVAASNNKNSQQWHITSAIPVEDGIYILKTALDANFALDVYDGSTNAGANIQIFTSNNTGAQKWYLTRNANGTYTIRNAQSNMTLSPASSTLTNKTNIYQSTNVGAVYQTWNIVWSPRGYFTLVNAADKNYVLAVNSTSAAKYTNVLVGEAATTPNRGWKFVKSSYTSGKTFYLYLDAGHITGANGSYDSGAIGNGYREADLTKELVNLIASKLSSQGVMIHTSINDNLNFTDRMAKAASLGCTDFVSIHFNSGGKDAKGTESYIAATSAGGTTGSATLQNDLHTALVKALGLGDRGKFSLPDPFAVTKGGKYGIHAVLLEVAFVSNANDMKTYQSKKNAVADALSNAIINYAKKTYGSATGQTATRAATKELSGANEYIMGKTTVAAAKMVQLYNSKNVKYPTLYASKGAVDINAFINILIEEANTEGVRAEVAFAQIMNETGWLQFGGDVKVNQCNFGGIGATGGGNPGNTFANVREGIRVNIQHLKAYASTDALKNAVVDPRFKYVTRGVAPTVAALSGTWSASSDYSARLMAIINELK